MIERISYMDWNSLSKKGNEEVDVELNYKDIVYRINDLYCACETKNECNNILIYSDKYTLDNIKSMLLFIYILGKYEGIEYITVVSTLNRYRLFKKIFRHYGAFFPPFDNGTREKMVFKLDDKGLDYLYKFIADYEV